MRKSRIAVGVGLGMLLAAAGLLLGMAENPAQSNAGDTRFSSFNEQVSANVERMIEEGRKTFRFDTFGDEAFWGGTLKLHLAIEGSQFGGVGPGVSPKTALELGSGLEPVATPGNWHRQLRSRSGAG